VKTADASAAELAEINAILEPYLWIQQYGQPYHGLLTGRLATGPYTFTGIVKPDYGKMTKGTPGRDGRAYLIGRAEAAIEAVEAAGWLLTGTLDWDLTSRTAPFTQTLTGDLVEKGEVYDMELRVRFEVNRPR
jgi:hypothetical protein